MDTLTLKKIYKDLRNSLDKFSSKEFLIFLFFLAVSAFFWFLSTLNDTYEKEYAIGLTVTSVPNDIVITEPLPDTIRVVIKDKGFNLLKYAFAGMMQPIQLKFGTYARTNGKGSVTQNDIQKILKGRIAETTHITSIKADKLEFYYSHGTSKKVPILIAGQLVPASNYFVTRTMLTPDSATVYATKEALDTINAVFTESLDITGIKESVTYNVPLQGITGAKIDPRLVKMSLFADQMTEVVVNVPIKTTNVPEGMALKTFPARVDIRVAVPLNRSGAIKPDLFTVVADYNELPKSGNDRLNIRIFIQPKGIVRATLGVHKVDYVIENYK